MAATKAVPEGFEYITVPRDRNSSDLFVSVNNETFLIQRGKKVLVPDYVARVIENSIEQDERTAERIEAISSK